METASSSNENNRNTLDAIKVVENDPVNEEYKSLLNKNDEQVPTPTPNPSRHLSRRELIVYIACFLVALIFWNIPPKVDKGITKTSMHLFAVFLLIVLLLLFTKARISIVIAFSLAFLSLSENFKCRTLNNLMVDCSMCGKPIEGKDESTIYQCNGSKGAFAIALSGFADPINWLVFFAYQIGYCIENTGFGKRVSYIILKHFGTSLQGIGYAIFIIELVLAPFIPSNVARGGCIVLPIIASIIENISQNYHVSSKVSDFLYLCGNHANLIISSIYLTGSASNPVLVSKVNSVYGLEYDLTFMKWLIGSIVPGIVVICITPKVIGKYLKQENMSLEHTQHYSERMLRQMKDMTKDEKSLCFVFIICLILWITAGITGIDATLVTFIGVLSLLTLNVMTWDNILTNKKAWDTFFWLGGMIVMANQLSEVGISALIGDYIATFIEKIQIYPAQVFLLFTFYFITMIFFSSVTGHVIAFAGPFMNAAEKLNIPKGLTVAFLAYYTLLCASLTHYSCGSTVMYYSKSHIKTKRFMTVGFIIGFITIGVYSTIGSFWWRIIGWY
ncbi:hypothetical protein BCR36DRAFT_326067 [Piromyces finnis]|uniref:Sodium/sulfate symporter n=1 Tax=Piromyces finnis TaxID=1754191 RepID=A0A1Y1VBB5_9FUNG|nr:hypothetical protein BCR36DRAFT_326067 [Piromyces finnis]|eukprot:ORX51054.1 hypothetical protein BCR36DRAFT_326067 [Piromyces finnis]